MTRKCTGKNELRVSEIMGKCSTSSSRIDLAFLDLDPMMLLRFIEVKKEIDGPLAFESAIQQTVSYMLCPLAYCRWGIWERTEQPLASLIVCFHISRGIGWDRLETRFSRGFGSDLSRGVGSDRQETQFIARKRMAGRAQQAKRGDSGRRQASR